MGSSLVNLQQNEYNKLQKELKKIHEDIVNSITSITDDIKSLMQDEYIAKDVSDNVKAFTEAFNSDLTKQLSPLFESSEKAIDTFITTIVNCDTIC